MHVRCDGRARACALRPDAACALGVAGVCQVCVVCRDAWSFSSIGPCGVVLIGPWRLNSELFAHWHPLAFCFCGGSQSVLCDCVVETVCGIYETGGVYTSVV